AAPAAPSAPAAPAAPPAPAAGGAVVGTQGQRADQGAVQRGADQTVAQRTEQKSTGQQPVQQSQPGQQAQQAAQSNAPAAKDVMKKPDQAASPDVVAFVYLHAFPRGSAPKASERPSEQTDPTADATEHEESDGLRFRPQDHPHADLVSTRSAQPRPAAATALGPDHLVVRPLVDGYDPQAGLHEREWDDKYVRRTEPFGHVWPDPDTHPEGGYEASRPDVLPAGAELDRFGTDEGRVLTKLGTRYAARSLPPEHLAAGYRRYVVRQPLPVWRTISAPWFGQPGGGTRYRTTYPVADLVALGYLMELA
ncbi:MAG: TNT domain-containing protein, partial [Umezawaea sp.]